MIKGVIVGIIILLLVVGATYYYGKPNVEVNNAESTTPSTSTTETPTLPPPSGSPPPTPATLPPPTLPTSGAPSATPQSAPPPSPPPSGTSSLPLGKIPIAIQESAFTLKTLTIKLGTTVEWTNKDTAPHTVTSDTGSELNSQSLSTGQTYLHTFSKAGTYTYHCALHESMKATIIVES